MNKLVFQPAKNLENSIMIADGLPIPNYNQFVVTKMNTSLCVVVVQTKSNSNPGRLSVFDIEAEIPIGGILRGTFEYFVD